MPQVATIYLDAGSIHAEVMRRHPEIRDGYVFLNLTNAPHWATFLDKTHVVDGPADIAWNERFVEDYHGFQIEMLRLRNVEP